jgi:dTDP-4-dehydrorhamnose reductase
LTESGLGATVLVVGADSEVGAAVLGHLASRGQRAVGTTRRREHLGPDRAWLDLADFDESWDPPAGTTAACICAARSRLADCAADPTGTSSLNVTQTGKLVTRLTQLGIYTLFLSSNQVFDGEQPFVVPEAPPCPVSEYGRQKAAAEEHVLAATATGYGGAGVLRLSRVLGPRTPTIANWVGAVSRGEPIRAFSDMVLAPVPVEIVATAVHHLLTGAVSGIFQLSGPADVTYAHFARRLVAGLGRGAELVQEASAGAARLPPGSIPRHTTLVTTELSGRGVEAPDIDQTVRLLVQAFERATPPAEFLADSAARVGNPLPS